MILSDGEIREALGSGAIQISPEPGEEQYTSSALDLFLGNEFKELVDPTAGDPRGIVHQFAVDCDAVDLAGVLAKYTRDVQPGTDGSVTIGPSQFMLGITREQVTLPHASKIAARVEGRSTLARLGLVVHLTAPTIHAGFSGHIVLEMYNLGKFNLLLRPGKLAICQLIFERLGQAPVGPINTTFQNQTRVGGT